MTAVVQPTFTTQVDFTHDPTSASFTWVDLTSRALAVSTSRGRSYELATVEAGTAQALLKNTDGALDPTNTASAYAPNVLPYRRVRLLASLSPMTNLVPNPSFEIDTSGWGFAPGASGSTFARSTAQARFGSASALYASGDPAGTPSDNYVERTIIGLTNGQQYTVSAYVYLTGNGSTFGARDFMLYSWGSTGVVAYNRTTLNAWQRVTFTFTPTTGQVSIRFYAPSGASLYLDGVQLEQAASASAYCDGAQPGCVWDGTPNASTSSRAQAVYTGLVERWPQQWANQYGTSPLQCVDTFAWLANRTLRSAIEHEMLADAPLSFYPLTDATGSLSAGDISGNSQPAAPVTVGPNTTGSAAFGATTALAGPLSGLALTSTQVGAFDNTAATYLAMSSAVLPATQPFTVEVWVQMTADQAVDPAILYYAEGNDYIDDANEVDLQIIGSGDATNPGKVQWFVFGNDNSGSAAGVLSTATVLDGKPHHLVGVLNGTTVQLYIDGVSQGTATLATAWKNRGGIGALGANLRDQVGQPFRGTCAMFATYGVALSATRIAAHYNAGLGFVGDTADARIARILGYAGWTAATSLDACTTTMLPAAIKGQSALAALQAVEASEGGTFFVASTGTLSYRSRRTRMATTASAVTFGEKTTATTNFIDNPSFEVDLSGGYSSANTIGTSTVHALYGGQSAQVTCTNAADSNLLALITGTSVAVGTWTFSSYVYLDAGWTMGAVHWGIEGGTAVQTSVSTVSTTATGTWQRISITITVTTAGTLVLVARYANAFSASGQKVWFDGIQFEAGAVPTEYCDGSLPGCKWLGAPNASFSTHAAEIPYTDVQFDFDPTYIYNDVQISRTSGAVAAAFDPTSQTHYGDRSLTKTLDTQSDGETIDAANWLLASYKAPHLRVAAIEVNAAATSGAWATLLPLEVGSRVTAMRRAPGSTNTIGVACFVEQIIWAIDANGMTAKCRLSLSPIPLQALIADDTAYGICDSTFVAAW